MASYELIKCCLALQRKKSGERSTFEMLVGYSINTPFGPLRLPHRAIAKVFDWLLVNVACGTSTVTSTVEAVPKPQTSTINLRPTRSIFH